MLATPRSLMLATPTKIMKVQSPISQKHGRVFKLTASMFYSTRKMDQTWSVLALWNMNFFAHTCSTENTYFMFAPILSEIFGIWMIEISWFRWVRLHISFIDTDYHTSITSWPQVELNIIWSTAGDACMIITAQCWEIGIPISQHWISAFISNLSHI